MRRPIPLDRPCAADWSAMTPVSGGRFCGTCRKTVHDLSAMSLGEARALLAGGEGELCLRYVHELDGRVLHRGEDPAARRTIPMRDLLRGRWARAASIVSVAAASMVMEACGGARARYDYTPHRVQEDEREVAGGRDESAAEHDGASAR